MKNLIHQIINPTQENLFRICKYLSSGREHTIANIMNAMPDLNRNSSVVYKYMNKLKELGIVNVRIEKKIQYFSLNRTHDILEDVLLNEDDNLFLSVLENTLQKHKNLPIYDELTAFLKRRVKAKTPAFSIIEFDTAEQYRGDEFLYYFYYRIKDRERAKFSYQSFESSVPKDVIIKPYLLKEYNQRWYLVGKYDGFDKFVTYALDRVKAVDYNYDGTSFSRDVGFDPKSMWQHCIGILEPSKKPNEVSFELKNALHKNIEFLETAKLHPTQKVEHIKDSPWAKVSMKVVVSIELGREIRKWGVHNIRNIKPKSLDKIVREG